MTRLTFAQRAQEISQQLNTQPLVRSVNFHTTPRAREREYAAQIEAYAKHFSSVTEQELDDYLRTGQWEKEKPGLIIALYEGYRDHFDVIIPILERHHFVAWFFVITEFVKSPPGQQITFAAQHDISIVPNEYVDGRYALSWDELRQLDGRHVIASHARTHTELATLDATAIEREVIGSQQDFREFLGRPVRTFVSYAGPAYGEVPAADRWIDAAEYQFVFSNYQIQRIRDRPPGTDSRTTP